MATPDFLSNSGGGGWEDCEDWTISERNKLFLRMNQSSMYRKKRFVMTSNLHVMCTIIVRLCVKSLKGNRYWPTQLNSEQRIRFLKPDLKYIPVFDPMHCNESNS